MDNFSSQKLFKIEILGPSTSQLDSLHFEIDLTTVGSFPTMQNVDYLNFGGKLWVGESVVKRLASSLKYSRLSRPRKA